MTIQEYTDRLLAHAGFPEAEVKVEEKDEEILVELVVDEEVVGMLIGHHGETLASFQRIVRLVFKDNEKRIVLDVNDYRERRKEKLEDMTYNIAQRVLDSGEEYVFPYLPSNERFIIHSTLSGNSNFSELESVSEGEGFQRRLIIRLKN